MKRISLSKILGIDGYEIDTNGNVFSCRKLRSVKGRSAFEGYLSNEWTKLKPYANKKKYLMLNFHGNGVRVCDKLHRLLAKAFIPNPENKPCVCHKNGNPQDNRLENLYWGTFKENMADRSRHGNTFRPIGESHAQAKLNEKQVRVIKWIKTIPRHISRNKVAEILKVKPETIMAIWYGRTWKNVKINTKP